MQPRGFIALMSVIIISAILLSLIGAGSLLGFFTNSVMIDEEEKAQSREAADACLHTAVLKLTLNTNYSGSEFVTIDAENKCFITAVTTNGVLKMFIVQATSTDRTVTTLSTTYDTRYLASTTVVEIY